jgi:hypothetical protein
MKTATCRIPTRAVKYDRVKNRLSETIVSTLHSGGRMRSFRLVTILGVVIYLVVAGLLVAWLTHVRNWSFETQTTSQAQSEWQRWKKDAARPATTEGSVERRVPVSQEPPLLVLMREHFAMSVVATLFFWTALFAPLIWMLRGVLREPATPDARRAPLHE